VYVALFGGNTETQVADFSLPESLTYAWTTQSLLVVVAVWGSWDISESIRNGDVINDLTKPFDFFVYWLSRDLGRALYFSLTRLAPILLFGRLFYQLELPGSFAVWLAFLLSVVIAVMVSFSWRFIMNLSSFWLLDAGGIASISFVLVTFFSGFLVPLAFFPSWLRLIADALPFRAFVMIPVEILLERGSVIDGISTQLAWLGGLLLVSRLLLSLALRKVVFQGG
jgi:ABC-2 type transport system permease protein